MEQCLFSDFQPSFGLPGLSYREHVLSPREQDELVGRIAGERLEPFRFQGWFGKRLTRSFGWSYDFATGRFDRAEPIPGWLLPVREAAARFAGLAPDDLVQALLIRYDPGAGIGWHKDRPVFEHVVGLSLGAAATLRLRRRKAQGEGKGFDRLSIPTAPGSIYHLSGEARHQWEHSIAPIEETRWSVTFRSLAASPARS